MNCARAISYCTIAVLTLALSLPGQQGPVRIEVTPANASIAPSSTQQFDAFRLDLGALNQSGGRTKITGLANWLSSDQNVATVIPSSGMVTAVNPGVCKITAVSGPFRGSALLHVTGPFCGDGILQTPKEQCDDGGNVNLDGCSATCKFEQNQRVNSLQMQFLTDAFCTANAFGGAIVGAAAQSGLQNKINTDINNGSVSMLLAMLGITDLSGTTEPSFHIGALNGTPLAGAGYNGASDLDWWYTADPAAIDGNRAPKNQLSASISGNALSVNGGSLLVPVLGGALNLSNIKVEATTVGPSAPTTSAGSPPGHLSSEHVDPTLTSYSSMANGELCGGVSAESLALTPAPSLATSCSPKYAASNSLLDVLVGGCTLPIVGAQITSTQPDLGDSNKPYTLQTDPTTHVVNGCKDKNLTPVPLPTCLAIAAYSSFFEFTTDRVIIK
jgi:cysteine-rich repeat protein